MIISYKINGILITLFDFIYLNLMGCFIYHQNEFIDSTDQNSFNFEIEEKRLIYDERLKDLLLNAIQECIDAGKAGKDKLKLISMINENYIREAEIIEYFLTGITNVQNKLKSKNFEDLHEIKSLLSNYFKDAIKLDKNKITKSRQRINNWIVKN